MKSFLIALVFLFTSLNIRAQFLDSLHQTFNGKSIIDARLESRWSFIRNELIAVSGVRLGVAYKRKLRIGGGISWLKTNWAENFYTKNALGEEIKEVKYLKFAYLCYYIDFVYYRTKRWQLSVPIQMGSGMSWYQTQKEYRLHIPEKKKFLLLYEPGITVQFKITRWLGAGTDVAFRFVMRNEKKIGEQLNSPTLSIKALFWPDQLFYEVFPKTKITQKYGPAEW